MTRRGLRLLPVAAAAWGAAALASMVPVLAPWTSLACWVLALAALGLAWGRPRWRGKALTVVVLTLVGAAAAASHVALAQPAREAAAGLAIDGDRAIEVTAVVTGKPATWASGTLAFDAVASSVRIGGDAYAVSVEVQVLVDPPAQRTAPTIGETAPTIGETVRLEGSARRSDPGERAVLVVEATRGIEVVDGSSGVLALAAALRAGLVAAVDGLPEPGAGLVPGLAVGDTSIVEPALDAEMKSSSLSHLTAVSGANCAIVVGLAFAAAAGCGARRGVRVAVALGALAGFVVLVTPEPSVVRAAAMAAVAMIGLLLGRPAAGVSVLALGVAVLLVIDPWLSTSLGFALSAVATGSLLVLARPLAAGLERWLPRALALALAVPLAAQLACGPLLVLIAPSIPVYGVVANLLAAPAAPVATIVGLAACLAAPFAWLQSGLVAVSWLPAAWIAGTARTFAALPGAQVPWTEGVGGFALLAALGAAIAVVVTGRGSRRVRQAAGAVLAVLVGVAVGSAALSTVAGRLTLPADWSILACDVGQGDAVLVRSQGTVALIDSGPDPAALDACLFRAGIGRIDLLVLTHFDLDHVGGAESVVGKVGTLLHGPPATAQDARLVAELAAGGAEIVPASAGLRGSLGEAAWRVVWPPLDSRAFPSGNDASVVVEISGGGVPYALFLGDLAASPQRALAASGALAPPYALVKVAHHGSADQDAALYELLDPAVALVTVGSDNDYGHPRDETLALLVAAGARIARTDTEGMIALSTTPAGVGVWRERDVAPAR